jgi:signal peptidase II
VSSPEAGHAAAWRWFAVSGVIIAVDQAVKAWIVAKLQYGESVRVTSFFDIVYALNPGAAFSFLRDAGGWQRWFFLVLALVVSLWLAQMVRRHAAETLLPFALALILGGALGNVVDRIQLGAVVDFLYFHLGEHGFPAFNVADSCISVGVALLLLQQLLAKRQTGEST